MTGPYTDLPANGSKEELELINKGRLAAFRIVASASLTINKVAGPGTDIYEYLSNLATDLVFPPEMTLEAHPVLLNGHRTTAIGVASVIGNNTAFIPLAFVSTIEILNDEDTVIINNSAVKDEGDMDYLKKLLNNKPN